MRILAVGGAGFIGAHFSRRLLDAGHSVAIYDTADVRFGDPKDGLEMQCRDRLITGVSRFVGDAADADRLRAAMVRFDPDCVCYLAAVPLVGEVERAPAEAARSMLTGLTNCVEAIRASERPRRMLYVSSSMVYGDFASEPLPEDAATVPVNLYGGLKLAGELLTRTYLARTHHEFVVVRPSGVYGPADINNRVVQKCCLAAIKREPFTVTRADSTFIDFTWIDDLVEGLLAAATVPAAAGETFNLTFGQSRSLGELVDIVATRSGGLQVVHADVDLVPRPRRGTLDIAKARRLLGYAPRTCLEDGVAAYLRVLQGAPERESVDA